MKFRFPFTDRQVQMVEHPARILHIGCGTKTGKSMGLFCWLIEGLLKGEACCYCGPWFFRSRAAFDQVKTLLAPLIRSRQVRINEARMQATSSAGGYLDFTSGDNPNSAFGGNYSRVVVDEASRHPVAIWPAALTTISATNGKIRCAFNLELGSKNWAVGNLLRVQRMSPAEREKTGEDFLTFQTGGDGLVSEDLIALMKSQMPLPLWEALYLGKIPESDCSLFRNLDKIFVGRELEAPVAGVQYFLAADVARKKDFSVLTIIDSGGHVVAMDRFNQISWSLQVERAKLWYATFGCSKAIVDATGVGDVVAEEFEKAGMNVEPYIFTVPSRRLLIEELVVACDSQEITLPVSEKFKVYRQELESMEFQVDGTAIKYAVPSGSHDDALFSLALATHAFRQSRGMVLGLLDLLKRTAREISEGLRDAFGNLLTPKPAPVPKPASVVVMKPVEARVDGYANSEKRPRACPVCGNLSTVRLGAAGNIHCNQCRADFTEGGTLARPQAVAGMSRAASGHFGRFG